MSLYKRLHEVQKPTGRRRRADPVIDELRQKIHDHLIEELGPILYDKRLSEDELRRGSRTQLHAALAKEKAPLSAADKAQLVQDVTDDILGYGPIDQFLQGRRRHRGHGQRPRPGLRRAPRQDRADRHARSSTRPTCAASSTRSWARSAGASTSRRRWSTPACPTAPASTRSCTRSPSAGRS